MAYKHVMAAVDLSDEANQVLDEAKRVAADHGAKLSLISVVKPLTQVYGGLAGLILVSDDEEKAARLPTGEYDIPLVIQDRAKALGRQVLVIILADLGHGRV